eukprot:NODE_56_length_28873_cov_1.243101.p10 type:complete len:222 gc:universal NODE_56_length_28873_cov_1.243101:28646-27981(-)
MYTNHDCSSFVIKHLNINCIPMPGVINNNIRHDLTALYTVNLTIAILCIVYDVGNGTGRIGYLLLAAALMGFTGFYHKFNIIAMFSHVCLIAMSFEYAYLFGDLKDGSNSSAATILCWTLLIYCPIHLVAVINRLIVFYHYMRKYMRRLKRRRERAKSSGDNRRSRPVSIMQLREDIEDDEEDYDIWKSWVDLFKGKSNSTKSNESKRKSVAKETSEHSNV